MLTGVFNALISILLHIDVVIYSLIGYLFQVFIFLANESIFTEDTVKILMDRVYVVVGVVSLFLLAFSLLQSLVNPDDLTKGKNSPVKIIKNVLISLALLGFTPVIFNFAYEAQNRIINSQILSKLILGGDTVDTRMINCKETEYLGEGKYDWEDTQEILKLEDGVPPNLGYIGNSMAVNLFSSFFYGEGKDGGDYYGKNIKSKDGELDFFDLFGVAWSTVKSLAVKDITILVKSINENIENVMEQRTLCSAYEYAKIYGDFDVFNKFSENTLADKGTDEKINYTFIVSTIAGGLVLYFLFSFCIGLAVRAVKLGYYQLIAPIPILARIVPQGQKIFDNWLKGVLSTFAEVFIRLLVVFFTVFMIETGVDVLFGMFDSFSDASLPVLLLAKALLIIGILIFAKKAPSFITDMIGIKSGSLKLGIKDQIREAALIGKPIATTMDKAQGFITSGAGAGWSYLKGSFGRKRPEGGSFGQAVLTGGISGAAKGGNQFTAGRDAEFKRETGKEGPDSIWGEIERRSKAYTKEQNAKARAAYKQVITDAEATTDFDEAINQALKQALLDPKVQQEKEEYVSKARNSYIGKRLDEISEPDSVLVNQIKNSDLYKQMVEKGMEESTALKEAAKMSNDLNVINEINSALNASYLNQIRNSDLYKQMVANGADEVTAVKEIAKASNNNDVIDGVNNILNDLGNRFDNSHRHEEAEKSFDEHYRIEHDVEIRTAASKEYQKTHELYAQAKGVIGDWETAERQKDFKAVVEKMMKDEKEKGSGPKPPKDDSKK